MNDLTPEQKAMTSIDYLFKRSKEKNDQPERILQRRICSILKENYPDVYFVGDPMGIYVHGGARNILEQTNSSHKHLDLAIFKRSICGKYSMLILEIKIDSPFLSDGTIKKDSKKHLQKQYDQMLKLRAEGYRVEYAWTEKMANDYLVEHIGYPVIDLTPLF